MTAAADWVGGFLHRHGWSIPRWMHRRRPRRGRRTNAEYWTGHNVTIHRRFATRDESLAYFRWRQTQYLFNDECLPYSELSEKVVLDYGCGPGDDLVGIVEQSRPKQLIGADISSASLAEARERLRLHSETPVEFLQLHEGGPLPLEDAAVDVIVSMGVLHHIPDLPAALTELRRVIRPDGVMYAMVYNRNSIWARLYVPYIRQLVRGIDRDASFEDAFRASTDGDDCPYSVAFTPETFGAIAASAGWKATLSGSSVSMDEMNCLPSRFNAIRDPRFPNSDREFLAHLTFDAHDRPLADGVVAGIDAYYELRPD